MTTKTYSRPDGRQFDELRPLSFIPNYINVAEGSVLVTWGETRVLCNLTVEPGVPAWMAGRGTGWMTAEYAMLPRSTQTRTPRETKGLKGRTQEIRRLIGRSLRMAVDLDLLGERTLLLDCDVLQADGGTRVASITGGYLALALGLRPLIQTGTIPAKALRPPVSAVSVGMLESTPLLDLNYAEDSLADVDFNVVMTDDGRFIEVQGTGEGTSFSDSELSAMLALAKKGIREINALQKELLLSI
jgi:ribonuclease PH